MLACAAAGAQTIDWPKPSSITLGAQPSDSPNCRSPAAAIGVDPAKQAHNGEVKAMSSMRALLILLMFVPALLYAQLDRGSIVGTVSDPTAAAIPGVKLVVQNTATEDTYPAETNSVGQYLVPNLPTWPLLDYV
jgi:hypothetical protein